MPLVRPLWARHARRRFVEPFCGGLAMPLGLGPARALLNDANPHLINFYRWIQRGMQIDLRMENDEALYYAHRERFNALLDGVEAASGEAAALFYFLNRTGYNGLCRFNRSGRFNVPFGRYTRIGYLRDFSAYREALAGWTFANTDLEAVPLAPDDFVYADPPYDVEFTQYAAGGPFGWPDQERTAAWLARHPGPVVLVNQATRRIMRLYRALGYTVRTVAAPRRISCNGDRRPAREVMATRNV